MKKMYQILFFLTLAMTVKVKAEVWKTTQSWTDAHEVQYANWVEQKVNSDFFSNLSLPLQALVDVDCARAAYAMRLVFAMENGLTFKMIGTSGRVYDSSQDSKSFIDFAKQAIEDSSTYSLHRNSFPLQVDRKSIRPGTIFVFQAPGDRGAAVRHTYILKKITPSEFRRGSIRQSDF